MEIMVKPEPAGPHWSIQDEVMGTLEGECTGRRSPADVHGGVMAISTAENLLWEARQFDRQSTFTDQCSLIYT